jgi:hypothetical protein
MNGAVTCARYAFAPNYFQYCGPDENADLAGYIDERLADAGLVENLAQFETLYPYLKAIAAENRIADPLDPQVVEAYWVGNGLLPKMSLKAVHEALVIGQGLPKRLSTKDQKWLWPKIEQRAMLHHSFHVFNVFTRTGHRMIAHTVETMDQCRISWGKIISNFQFSIFNQVSMPKFSIKTQRLALKDDKLALVPGVKEVVVMEERLGRELKVGDYVSVHWDMVCERLSSAQVRRLQFYTQHHLRLANETL